jgi:hypothetical protein
LRVKNSHSIVIVVPLHVSKFYRVLKKLTTYTRVLTSGQLLTRWELTQSTIVNQSECNGLFQCGVDHPKLSRPPQKAM